MIKYNQLNINHKIMLKEFESGPRGPEDPIKYSIEDVRIIFLSLDDMSGFIDLDLYAFCSDEEEIKTIDKAASAFENFVTKFNLPSHLFATKFWGKEWEGQIGGVVLSVEDLTDLRKSLDDLGLLFEREWESSLPDESIELINSARAGYQELCKKIK